MFLIPRTLQGSCTLSLIICWDCPQDAWTLFDSLNLDGDSVLTLEESLWLLALAEFSMFFVWDAPISFVLEMLSWCTIKSGNFRANYARFEFWTALNQVVPVCHSTPKLSVLVAHILRILTNPRVIGLSCSIIVFSLSPHCESDTATLVHCHQLQVYRGLFAAERACQIGRSASLKHQGRHETRTSRPVAGLIRIPMCSSAHHWATCHLKTTFGDMTCAP